MQDRRPRVLCLILVEVEDDIVAVEQCPVCCCTSLLDLPEKDLFSTKREVNNRQ